MNKNLIFLKPYLSPKIWGGQRYKQFDYQLDNDQNQKIGEALIVSALPNESSIITNEPYNNMNLKDFFEQNRDFFGNYQGQYPILTKIIDANDDLSVQVHPSDSYAKEKHNGLGKTECWYILDAPIGAKIVYGLKTNNQSETKNLVEKKAWDQLLNYLPVKKGDIVYVPSGTVHAITSGILIYELQQSSDITYRLYDYDRLENNQLRPLHIDDAINVIKYEKVTNVQNDDYLIDCDFFKLKKYVIDQQLEIDLPNALWLEITVIEGSGQVDQFKLSKGSVFLVRNNTKISIKGQLTILVGFVTA